MLKGGNIYWELTDEGEAYISKIRKKREHEITSTVFIGQLAREILKGDMVKGRCSVWMGNGYTYEVPPEKMLERLKREFLDDYTHYNTGIIPIRQKLSATGRVDRGEHIFGVDGEDKSTSYRDNYLFTYKFIHLLINRLGCSEVNIIPQVIKSPFYTERERRTTAMPNFRHLISNYLWHVTYDGYIYMDRTPTRDEMKCIKEKNFKFKGWLYTNKNVNIPAHFPFEGCVLIPCEDREHIPYEVYKSVTDFRNRTERVAEITAKKKAESDFKTLVEKGFTPCLDHYGLRIKLGDHVAFKAYNTAEKIMLGTVISCTAKRVNVEEICTGFKYQIASTNLVKI